MESLTKQQLLDMGFKKYPGSVWIDPRWLKDNGHTPVKFVKHLIELRRAKIDIPESVPVYRNCSKLQQFLHINQFYARTYTNPRTKKKTLIFRGDSVDGQSERGKESRTSFNTINYPIFRYWFNGDENAPFKCLVTGEILEKITEYNHSIGEHRTFNLFDLHHILTVHKQSVHKQDTTMQPSNILDGKDLTLREHKHHLIDIMNTVCISPNEHDKVHCSSKVSDIKYWQARNAVPWGLQSKENFDAFCNRMNLNLDYDKFVNRQTLEWWNENKHNIDVFKTKQDIQEYLARFE